WRAQAARSLTARAACVLLRSGCLRTLGRGAPAQRSGVGTCGAEALGSTGCDLRRAFASARSRGLRSATDIWRCVAMDAQQLRALSGIPLAARRYRRIQWQIHGQPIRAAWQFVRNA